MHATADTRPPTIERAHPLVPVVSDFVDGESARPHPTTATEPSHIHILRPSRVKRPDAAPSPAELSELRESAHAGRWLRAGSFATRTTARRMSAWR